VYACVIARRQVCAAVAVGARVRRGSAPLQLSWTPVDVVAGVVAECMLANVRTCHHAVVVLLTRVQGFESAITPVDIVAGAAPSVDALFDAVQSLHATLVSVSASEFARRVSALPLTHAAARLSALPPLVCACLRACVAVH
jgi:hypothetical protein